MLCSCNKCRWSGAETEITIPRHCPYCGEYGGLETVIDFSSERDRLEMMANVTVHDLNRDCLIELKMAYVSELVNAGIYGEVVFDDESIQEPSYGELSDIDNLIPDDIIFEHYDGVSFTPDDFFCLMEMEG